jgi:hypothetical protein
MRTLRAYLAGTGATGALIAAAVVAFLTLAALVAFNGLPGGEESDEESLFVGPGGGAAQAAATALAAAPGAVAAVPAPVGPGAAGGPLVAGGGPGGGPGGGGPGGGPGSPTAPTPPGVGGTTTGAAPAGGTGPVGGLVDQIDETTGGAGLDLGLGETTDPITGPIDQTLEENLPGADDAVGDITGNLPD